MVVRAGREFLAIPGPTNMPDEVLQAMHRPSLDIYSREMIDLTDGLHADLANVMIAGAFEAERMPDLHDQTVLSPAGHGKQAAAEDDDE